MHLLLQCARLSGTAQREQRLTFLRDVRRTIEYVQETLRCPSGETRVLASIADVFYAQTMRADRVMQLICDLDFIPTEKDQIPEAVEKLQNDYPRIVPLLSCLMHIGCESCQSADHSKMSHTDRNDRLELLSVFQEFVHSVPPPFTDNQSTWRELEETADSLKDLM